MWSVLQIEYGPTASRATESTQQQWHRDSWSRLVYRHRVVQPTLEGERSASEVTAESSAARESPDTRGSASEMPSSTAATASAGAAAAFEPSFGCFAASLHYARGLFGGAFQRTGTDRTARRSAALRAGCFCACEPAAEECADARQDQQINLSEGSTCQACSTRLSEHFHARHARHHRKPPSLGGQCAAVPQHADVKRHQPLHPGRFLLTRCRKP